MADRHKHRPITFRPPERDRDRLLAYAERTGHPVRAVLVAALAAHLDTVCGDTTPRAETPQAETPRPASRPALGYSKERQARGKKR